MTGPQLAAAATVVTGPSSSLRLEAGHDGATRDGEAWTDSVGAPDAAPTLHWAGASWWRETRGVRFGLGADLRRVAGWRARTRAEDARGDVTALGVDAEAAYAGDGGTLSLRYRIDRPTSDTPDVDAALAATPRQQLRASATTSRLPGNFRLSGAAMLRSATTWPAAGADSVARELPALVRLDATVEKWLWRDRARVFAAARNLLDREERYHPAGAHFAFRVHVGAELDLR